MKTNPASVLRLLPRPKEPAKPLRVANIVLNKDGLMTGVQLESGDRLDGVASGSMSIRKDGMVALSVTIVGPFLVCGRPAVEAFEKQKERDADRARILQAGGGPLVDPAGRPLGGA
jgi:hypothetical protein